MRRNLPLFYNGAKTWYLDRNDYYLLNVIWHNAKFILDKGIRLTCDVHVTTWSDGVSRRNDV